MVSNAVDKFIIPLVGDERIQLLGNKPGMEHDAWCAKKDCFKKGGPKEHTVATPKVPTPASGSTDSSAAKLSLSKSPQAALVTTASLSAD